MEISHVGGSFPAQVGTPAARHSRHASSTSSGSASVEPRCTAQSNSVTSGVEPSIVACAAGEKLAVMQTMDYLRREAEQGRRADFEKYLAAVPNVPPPDNDRLD